MDLLIMPASTRSNFSINVLKLVGGTTLAQVITIVTAPIISRLFAPEHFGTYSILVSLVSVFSIVICLRYEMSIMLPAEDGAAANQVALSLSVAGVLSLTSTLVIALGQSALIRLLHAPELAPFLWLVPVALFIQGVFLASNNWNSRRKRFGRLSIARVAASLTTSIAPILLAFLGYANTTGLVISWLAGTFIFAAVLSLQVFASDWGLFKSAIHPRAMLDGFRRYRKFPLIDSLSSFFNNLSWQLPALMLSAFFSKGTVGYYALANRILLLPMTLVGASIAQVFFQRAAEVHAGQLSLQNVTRIVYRRLVSLSILPALVLAIAGRELFMLVFGSNWAEAGAYTQILAPWLLVLFVSSPLSQIYSILERQELLFGLNILILITRIASLVIGGLAQNVYFALWIWTISGILVYGYMALLNLKLAGLSTQEAFQPVIHYSRYCLPAAGIILILKLASPSALLLAAATLLLAGFYAALLVREDTQFFKNLFQRFGAVKES